MTKQYEVGYRKPPKSTQFKPGQSGNRKGRPKGRLNFVTELEDELAERLTVQENGVRKRISKQRALIKRLYQAAMDKDARAAMILFNMAKMIPGDDVRPPEDLTEADRQILENFKRRFLQDNAGG